MSHVPNNRRGTELTRQARTFLTDQLANGPQFFSMLRDQAAKLGISLSLLLTAKQSLHIKSRQSDGYAVWRLPAASAGDTLVPCPPLQGSERA